MIINKLSWQVTPRLYEQGEVLAIALTFDTSDLEYVTLTHETIKSLQVQDC
ncbi:MAG: hypothetical protein ACRAVC_16425 [Trichormus sp.]